MPTGVPGAAPEPDGELGRADRGPRADFELPKYLSSLIASINDGAKGAQTGALFFLGVGLYLLAVAFSTTDEDLLRERTFVVSQIGVAVPVVFSFAVAPLIFVFFHLHTLIRYDMLAANLKQFDCELKSLPDDASRERCRHLLANVEFLRGHGTTPGSPLTSRLFHAMSWFMLAGFPLAVLTIVQLSALRYQGEGIIGAQRAALVADAALLIWFFQRLWRMRQTTPPSRRRARGRVALHCLWVAPLLAFNLAYMGVPRPDATTVGKEANAERRKALRLAFRPEETNLATIYVGYGSLSDTRVPWSRAAAIILQSWEQPVDLGLCLIGIGCRYLQVSFRLLIEAPTDGKIPAAFQDDLSLPSAADVRAVEGLTRLIHEGGREVGVFGVGAG